MSPEKKKQLLKKGVKILDYLVNYKCSFHKDLDALWKQVDTNSSGFMDKDMT
jgi:hypothetical protein